MVTPHESPYQFIHYFPFTSYHVCSQFKKLETNSSIISLDHHQFDGQTKQVNQIVKDMLWTYVGKKPTK